MLVAPACAPCSQVKALNVRAWSAAQGAEQFCKFVDSEFNNETGLAYFRVDGKSVQLPCATSAAMPMLALCRWSTIGIIRLWG